MHKDVDKYSIIFILVLHKEEVKPMDLVSLIMPLGIVGYALMLLAILTGTRVIKLKVKHHKLIALIAMIVASLHFAIIIYYNYF